jgi:uncharacterized protein
MMNKRVQIIAIGLIVIFILPFVLPFIQNFFANNSRESKVEEYIKENVQPTAPPFKKEGELIFFNDSSKQEIRKVDIEIADSEGERMQGLMYRTSMEDTQGMLFIFPVQEPQSFWMKNTLISLDLLFVDEAKKIVTIQKYAQPKSENSIPSTKPAKYVIEVNAGFCDRYQIKEGYEVKF